MPGTLTHSTADVIRQLLIDLSFGTAPSAAGAWPIYVAEEPDNPDDVITIYDTVGTQDGRTQTDGELQEHHGFQVRVRAVDHPTGFTRARLLAVALDESIERNTVVVDSTQYFVNSVSRTSDVLALGKEQPDSSRNVFTINAIVMLRQV